MAYGDSGSGDISNKTVTFKGFSSRAEQKNFKLYDFEVAKQDLINRLSIRKGERVENPEFGTIIYDATVRTIHRCTEGRHSRGHHS